MRDRLSAGVLVTLMWVLGCTPSTHLLLRSRCDDASPNCDAATKDASSGCTDTSDCAVGEDCLKSVCIPCAKLLEACDTCPAATEPYKVVVGACVTCECRPICKLHSDCGLGMICAAGSCVECKSAAGCPSECSWGFSPQLVLHNGCSVCECAPKSACSSDAQCGAGLICYPGAQCDDGCAEPKCCHGNQCAAPGCKPPSDTISCTIVGCQEGECRGDIGCAATGCTCDPTTTSRPTGWSCQNDCASSCQGFR